MVYGIVWSTLRIFAQHKAWHHWNLGKLWYVNIFHSSESRPLIFSKWRRHLGMIPIINHDSSKGEQWGRSNLPRSMESLLLHTLSHCPKSFPVSAAGRYPPRCRRRRWGRLPSGTSSMRSARKDMDFTNKDLLPTRMRIKPSKNGDLTSKSLSSLSYIDQIKPAGKRKQEEGDVTWLNQQIVRFNQPKV